MNKETHAFFRGGLTILFVMAVSGAVAFSQTTPKPTSVVKLGYDLELRSDSKILMDQITASGGVLTPDEPSDASSENDVQGPSGIGNLQVNDPGLDSIQIFPHFRPFVHTTHSESSVATFGSTVIATYNSSAGIHLIPNPKGGLVFDRIQISAFSVSTDGGRTFESGFFPGVHGVPFTFGDPSVDVDRHGEFYFAQLGQDEDGNFGITVNTSLPSNSNSGVRWKDAVVVALDNGADKEWLAAGPDPRQGDHDNVYVTWSSFQNSGIQLRFAKSTDGGESWKSKTIFAPPPDPDPTHPQNALQFSNPVVDQTTGRLYVPFVHFSNSDTDFIQMLISDDAGETFRFATFNIAGAPDSTLLPIVQPGELTECNAVPDPHSPIGFDVNLRLTLHAGKDVGGSVTGLRRFVNSTRLIAQPAIAARDGVVYLAWNTSTSPFFGDPSSHSKIMFMRSGDGGTTWTTPIQVSSTADPHHVHPSLTIGTSRHGGVSVHITYYTQHSDASLDLVMSSSNDGGGHFFADQTVEISSTPFALPPTNIPIPSKSNPFATTNYDRVIAQCYALGEYQSVREASGTVYVLWGDTRNTIKEPDNALDPISGVTHPKEDVFFQTVDDDD